MLRKTTFLVSVFALLINFTAGAQHQPAHRSTRDTTIENDSAESGDDLMNMLDEEEGAAPKKALYTTATFKATRIINGHSIENVAPGVLDFRISHRFGTLNQGFQDFFGLDNATTRLGFDFGITPWLMVGIGRSSYQKEYDGFLKAKIFRQRESGGLPFSLSYLGAMGDQTAEVQVPAGVDYPYTNRLTFTNQLIIARKFTSFLSLQLMPTYVHYNLVPTTAEPNDVFAMGVAGRLKLNHRMSLTGEWFYVLPGHQLAETRNSLSFGLEIETGGHVFQLVFSNSTGMSERSVVGQTTGGWEKGDIHFGFNISRVFTIVKPKGFEGTRNKIY